MSIKNGVPPQRHCDWITQCFFIGSLTFIICSVYFPPSSYSSIYELYMSAIDSVVTQYPNYSFIFCGENNLLETTWSIDNVKAITTVPVLDSKFPVSQKFFHLQNSHSILSLIVMTRFWIWVSLILLIWRLNQQLRLYSSQILTILL